MGRRTGGLSEAGPGIGRQEGGAGMEQQTSSGAPDNADKREDRRVHRWAAVAAGLLLAMGAIALGVWWVAAGLVFVSLCAAIWAFSS